MADAPTAEFAPFDADGGLILAVRLPGDPDDFRKRRGFDDLAPPSGGPALWIHLDRTKERAQRWLRDETGLDPLITESLLAEETRPRAQAIEGGLLVILRGVNLNPGAEADELIAIRLWLESTRLITLRQFRFQTIADLRRAAQEGRAPATPGAFLAASARGLASRIGDSVGNLEEMLDDVEDAMLERDAEAAGARATLATIRRQAISYRRYLLPQREALSSLVATPHPVLSEHDRAELRFAAEQTARALDALEEMRDRAAVTQDELRARHEARVGRTVYLLTVVATVALPLSLITGLLGINVGGIPLAESPLGFVIVCVLLVGLAVGELLLFRSLRWL